VCVCVCVCVRARMCTCASQCACVLQHKTKNCVVCTYLGIPKGSTNARDLSRSWQIMNFLTNFSPFALPSTVSVSTRVNGSGRRRCVHHTGYRLLQNTLPPPLVNNRICTMSEGQERRESKRGSERERQRASERVKERERTREGARD